MKITLYILVISCALFTAYKMQSTNKLSYSRSIPIGNVLSAYFYFLSKNDKTIFTTQKMLAQTDIAPDLRQFYQRLTWYRTIKIINFDSDGKSAWNQIDYDGNYKPNYLQFWQSLRPVIQKIYAKSVPKIRVTDAVVHFRCSDIPFIKDEHYHLSSSATTRWMAQQIKERGYNTVILLNCNAHHKSDYNSCTKYVNFYKDIFTKAGLIVQIQCSSILNDFATMVHSPLLVSLNPGSFSFMAGIAKDPHDYISCNMGMEQNGKYILQTEADWILDRHAPLLHTEVVDYHDAETVMLQLHLK